VSRGAFGVLALAVTVAAVLAHGLARRQQAAAPHAEEPQAQQAPREPSGGLHPGLEKAPLSYLSDYWLQLGTRTKARLVLIGASRTPALAIAPDLAVTSWEAALDLDHASARGAAHDRPQRLASDADWGVALISLPPPERPEVFRPAASGSLRPGMLVAAVSLAPDERLRIIPGHLVSTPVLERADPLAPDAQSLELALAFPPGTRVAAVVDLDGNLVGAAFGSGGRLRLLSAHALRLLVGRLERAPPCRVIDAVPIDEPVRRLLGIDGGALVERVSPGPAAAGFPIRQGDVLLTWAGERLSGPAELHERLAKTPTGTSVAYALRRRARTVRGRTTVPEPDCAPAVDEGLVLPRTGVTVHWERSAAAWVVAAVRAGTPAAASGLRQRDRILAIDGRDVSDDAGAFGRRLEAARKPLLLSVRRGARARLLALPAPAG
jgi:hypothetical protein